MQLRNPLDLGATHPSVELVSDSSHC